MNLLLDTNVFIWFCENDKKLTENARNLIENENNKIYISTAVLWEIVIKKNIGKLDLQLSLPELYETTNNNGIEIIPINYIHILELESLPYHHKDPFDRIIIAQTIAEKMTLISSDSAFSKYDVDLIN